VFIEHDGGAENGVGLSLIKFSNSVGKARAVVLLIGI
jgi:hypothetical protein